MPRRRYDRLARLGACHCALLRARIPSPDAYRSATPERLDALHIFRAPIRELVARGHPDVIRALWPPGGRLHWSVARISLRPTVRLLAVDEGEIGTVGTARLRLIYDLDVTGDERRVWRALLEALRG